MSLSATILAESNIVLYCPLNDTSVATLNDVGPNNLDGSYDADCLVGAVGIDGLPGGAAKFAEPTNQGSLATPAYHASMITNTLSVEFCIRFNRWDNIAGSQVMTGYGFNGPQIHTQSVGSGVGFSLKKHSGSEMNRSTTGPITDTYLWHHVIVTWDNTNVCIWIDAVNTAGTTTSQTIAAGGTAPQICSAFLQCCMAHYVYYNKVLGPSDVLAHYAAFQADENWTAATSTSLQVGLHQGLHNAASDDIRLNQLATATSIDSTVTRTDFRWDMIEATGVSGYDWTLYDTIVDEVRDASIPTLIFAVLGSPTWHNGGADINDIPGTGVDATFNTWVDGFETFITDAVERYKPGGTGNPDNIDIYWELWNEPNLGSFWDSTGTPSANATQYGTWYKAIYEAIVAEHADAKVSFGSISGWYNLGVDDRIGLHFLKEAIAVGGLQIDYLAFHPYVSGNNSINYIASNSNLFSDTLACYDTLASKGFPNAKLLLTEFGWPDTITGTTTAQAAYLSAAFRRIATYWGGFVEMAIWFRDWDFSGGDYGLYSAMPAFPSAPTPKPAADAFAAFAASLDAASDPSNNVPRNSGGWGAA